MARKQIGRTATVRVFENQLITSGQPMSANFADVGSAEKVIGSEGITAYFNVDINQFTDITFKVLTGLTSAALTATIPNITVSATSNNVDDANYVLQQSADGIYALYIPLRKNVPYIKFQIKGTDGGTDGILNNAWIVWNV